MPKVHIFAYFETLPSRSKAWRTALIGSALESSDLCASNGGSNVEIRPLGADEWPCQNFTQKSLTEVHVGSTVERSRPKLVTIRNFGRQPSDRGFWAYSQPFDTAKFKRESRKSSTRGPRFISLYRIFKYFLRTPPPPSKSTQVSFDPQGRGFVVETSYAAQSTRLSRKFPFGIKFY